jgi:hypothetical protein
MCPSSEEWINKMWYIHIMKYYAALKKEGNPIICNDMDESGGHILCEKKRHRKIK